jgi:hypothetical protein
MSAVFAVERSRKTAHSNILTRGTGKGARNGVGKLMDRFADSSHLAC